MSDCVAECIEIHLITPQPCYYFVNVYEVLNMNQRHSAMHSYFSVLSSNLDVCVCYFSVTKSCMTLCNPVDCSIPSVSVLHCLLEFAQIHVH